MNLTASSLIRFLFAAWAAGLLVSSRASTSTALETEIRRVDSARIDSILRADHKKLKSLFHPECVYTHASGRVDTGTEYLARLERGDLRYRAMAYDGTPLIRMPNATTAVLSTRIRLTSESRGGTPQERVLASTAVYVLVGSAWQLIAFQSTPIPPPSG